MGKVKEALCPAMFDDQEPKTSGDVYICSECGEWTSDEDTLDGDEGGGSCCDAGPSNHEYESDYER